MISELRIHA